MVQNLQINCVCLGISMKIPKINDYFCQDNKLQAVRDKVLRLSSRADDIREQVENEECQKQKKRKREVEEWLRNVHRKVDEVHDLEEQLQVANFITSMNLRSQIENLEEDVEQLLKQSEFPHGLVLDDLEPEGMQLVPMKLEGLTPSMVLDEICSCLLAAGHVRIGIYGMGGVGKTTLAMHVHNRILKSSKAVGHVFWVTVSRDTSIYKLQSEIAKALKLDLLLKRITDEKKRAAKLSEFFRSLRKGFMLILDDVWENVPIEKIGVPVEESKCKLLITTRKLDVCRRMKCQPFKVEPLLRNEAWDLFVNQLGNYEALSEEAKDIARSVADECAGLPLGIVTMAGCMRGVDNVHEWRNVLRELQNSSLSQNDMENEVYSIMKLSYARLNSEKLQQCFLFCAMYPEDHEIGRDELINYFIAEGLVDGRKRHEQIDEGHTLLNRLENSCLLEPVTSFGSHRRCVKMHDLVRDMAINIMRENCRGMLMVRKDLKEVPSEHEWVSTLVKVSLGWNGITCIAGDTSPRCPNLSTLLLLCNPLQMIPNSFFVHMIGLKVLDLSNTLIEELPDSVSDLYNLNALSLDSCENLHFIPSLAKLTKLRELDLCDTDITNLPDGMEELASLKHLDLRYTDMSKSFPSRLLQGLSNLQSLLTTDVAISARELTSLKHLESFEGLIATLHDFNEYVTLGYISQLKYYYLNVESVTEYEDHRFSRSVAVGNCRSRLGTEALLMLPYNVQYLCLETSPFSASSLLEASPSLNNARDLKRCKLSDCDGIKYIMSSCRWLEQGGDAVLTPLQGLEELYLKKLSGFCSLMDEEMVPTHGHGIFYSLRKLEVDSCPRLRKLFSMDSLNHPLLFLEEIQILRCEGIEEVFATTEQRSEILMAECDEASIMPKLEALRLSNLPKLKKLVVSACPRIKKLLSLDVVNHHLPSLEEVHVSHCGQIEEIFATAEEVSSEEAEILLPMLRVLKLLDLPELKSVCVKTMVCSSLRELKVMGCDKLTRLPISIPRLLVPNSRQLTTPDELHTLPSNSGTDQRIA